MSYRKRPGFYPREVLLQKGFHTFKIRLIPTCQAVDTHLKVDVSQPQYGFAFLDGTEMGKVGCIGVQSPPETIKRFLFGTLPKIIANTNPSEQAYMPLLEQNGFQLPTLSSFNTSITQLLPNSHSKNFLLQSICTSVTS